MYSPVYSRPFVNAPHAWFKTVAALGLALAIGALCDSARADDAKPAQQVELKVGDPAPAFEARTDADTTWESSSRFGKRWVVIYFYPGDFTPGCTAQAKAFRETMQKLSERGVEVVGVSGDSVQTHEAFKKAYQLNFTLLSDEEGVVAKKYGVPIGKGGSAKTKGADGSPLEFTRKATLARWTYVIGKDGKIAYLNTKANPAQDAKNVAEFIAKAEEK